MLPDSAVKKSVLFFSRPGGTEENLARMELTFLVAAHIDIVRKVPVLEWMWAGVVYAGRVIPRRWEEQ